MRKACVISPYGLFNYGNRLQAYAVTRLLNRLDIDAEAALIPGLDRQRGAKKAAKMLFDSTFGGVNKSKRIKAFRQFDALIPKRRFDSESGLATAGYDYAVIGSDQIWNPNHISPSSALFGSFVDPSRRISLAPSFGVDALPDDLLPDYARGIEGIKWLSVREEAGKSLIKELTGREATLLADPTFALSPGEWEEVASFELVPSERYVFSYFLGSGNEHGLQQACKLAKKLNCENVDIMNPDLPYYAAGPQDFIGLIKGASFVCTNSYHAAVFSLKYNSPFRVFSRYSKASMSSRLETLAKHFEIDEMVSNEPILEIEPMLSANDTEKVFVREEEKIERFLSYAASGKLGCS